MSRSRDDRDQPPADDADLTYTPDRQRRGPSEGQWAPYGQQVRQRIPLGGRQPAQEEHGGAETGLEPPITYGNPHPRAGEARQVPSEGWEVPDMVLDLADFDALAVRGASLRGDDHRFNREPRQDSMGMWKVPVQDGPDLLVVAVADGLGSAERSWLGSLWACWMLRDQVRRHAEDDLCDDLFHQDHPLERLIIDGLARGMGGQAVREGIEPRQLSTTLAAAIIELSPPDRPRRCKVLRVGDSSVYVLREDDFQDVLADVHADEAIVSSATAALPTSPGMAEAAVVQLGNDDVLVVCTDGLTNPMRANTEIRRQLVRWWSAGPIPGALEFGWQLGFRAKSFGDDRTAICVWGHR